MRGTLTQIFPPKPGFTEKNLPNLGGKVYMVTGSNTGIGKELTQLLYSKNAKVYMAARSEEKARAAMDGIRAALPDSTGTLVFLQLDLEDLTTIKASVERFLSRESQLHVLFNNAGVMTPKGEQTTVQGHEVHIGINNLGTFLLTKLLTPTMLATARREAAGAVRVVWVSSSGTELMGTKDTGVPFDKLGNPGKYKEEPAQYRYCISKAGNFLHGVEFARRYRMDGVMSIPLNPGNLTTELGRDASLSIRMAAKIVCYPPINGAYTELYAGFSPDLTLEKSGSWVVPFGRILPIRSDLVAATKLESEGGNGAAEKFWEWSEEQTRAYL